MTRHTKAFYVLLPLGPLLVGGAAPQRQPVKNETTSSSGAVTNVVDAPSRPIEEGTIPSESVALPVASASAASDVIDVVKIVNVEFRVQIRRPSSATRVLDSVTAVRDMAHEVSTDPAGFLLRHQI